MSFHFVLRPLRRAARALLMVAMIPVFALAILVVIPVSLFSMMTGIGAKVSRRRVDVARTIEAFVDGRGGQWDWDDFISVADTDPLIEEARLRCARTHDDFPPEGRKGWCSPAGVEELRSIARELRESIRDAGGTAEPE